ncbi:class I SAM-dependent methyltransferase [Cryptosporangium sp. NPDC048952]|uniref:class I SAM-dependent methyltransferase n=1 Tax=Cryptosporangium sp. NPDC048952 TaxID=3363961 RepID=UPI00371814BB
MLSSGSKTAVHVALFRALESVRDDRLFSDSYARLFLPRGYRVAAGVARFRPVGRRLEQYIDARWGGPRGSAVARTRLIDDWVDDAVSRGARQLLVLGAGFDSRAHRLPALSSVDVFEVDHPATQASKQRILAGRTRSDVRFVPVDFLYDDLGSALASAGFSPTVQTVVVWEGVTNYLTAAAVDVTLRYLGGIRGEVIFTYVDKAVLDGGVADAWRGAVTAVGEPWTFGFDPASLADYLRERGLTLVEDVSTRDAAQRYQRPQTAAEFYRVARARVGVDAEGE